MTSLAPLIKNASASDGVVTDFTDICIRGHAHCRSMGLELCGQGILRQPIQGRRVCPANAFRACADSDTIGTTGP